MKKKLMLTLTALVLVVACAIGGTLAWLSAETASVTNTFTYGDINIELWEHKLNTDKVTLGTEKVTTSQSGFKMLPGNKIAKDPTVTVKAGSEACWLFVEIAESDNFDDFLAYAIDDGWKLYTTTTTGSDIDTVTKDTYVIYREVAATVEDVDFTILAAGSKEVADVTYSWEANKVFTLPSVTKEALNALADEACPSITFKAYAVQKDNVATAEAAWTIAKPSN